jgi:hypothetical protein
MSQVSSRATRRGHGDPGMIMTEMGSRFNSTWPKQTEVTVKGKHFLQEDSPVEIGCSRCFVRGIREPADKSITQFDGVPEKGGASDCCKRRAFTSPKRRRSPPEGTRTAPHSGFESHPIRSVVEKRGSSTDGSSVGSTLRFRGRSPISPGQPAAALSAESLKGLNAVPLGCSLARICQAIKVMVDGRVVVLPSVAT